MYVDHFDTNSPSVAVNFQHSGVCNVPIKILDPSEHVADDQSIIFHRLGTMVMHDCAPVAGMSILLCADIPTTHPSSLKCHLVREKAPGEEGAVEVFLRPLFPPAADETDSVQPTGETTPRKRPCSPRSCCRIADIC